MKNLLVRPRPIRALCAAIALLGPLASNAQPEEGSEIEIGAAVLNFGYKEFDYSDKLLNREDGNLPGATLRLSHSRKPLLFAGDVYYYGGDVAYDGQTDTGIPVTTRTGEKILDTAVRAEYWLARPGELNHALYAGAGYHRWQRDIRPTYTATGQPVSGLFETYQWWFAFVGAKLTLSESPKVRWLLDTRVVRLIHPSITVESNGLYDNARLDLGERWGGRLALPWRYTMSRTAGLTVEPFVESFGLGRSTTAVGTVSEPRSETRNYGLVISVSQHF
jgi:hypothetical protein